MNIEIAQRWVDALRSGEYKQARGALGVQDDPSATRYCCLGVLCELAVADGVITAQRPEWSGRVRFGAALSMPDPAVCEWIGAPLTNWQVTDPEPRYREPDQQRLVSLDTLNDIREYSFDQIADLIEREWIQNSEHPAAANVS